MEGHYILPGELAALIAFLLFPPLLIALVFQGWFMKRRGVFDEGVLRGSIYLIATVATSIALAAGLMLFGPDAAGPFLRVRDLRMGDAYIPIWPPAYVLIPFLAIISSWFATLSR